MTRPQLTSRGRGSGVLLMLLGAWGAVVPFVGPYFGYAFTPDKTWTYNSGRLWLSIVPGAAALLGGFLVVASRRIALLGGFLAALGGVWFVIGQGVTAIAVKSITPGTPVGASGDVFSPATMKFLEGLGFFYGLGVVIVFFAALAIGKRASAKSSAKALDALPADAFAQTNEYGAVY
jgi:hypothetical protein